MSTLHSANGWMDGKREVCLLLMIGKRIQGHDWSIIKLGVAGIISEIIIDTAFFTGNHVPKCSIQYSNTDQNIDLIRRSEIGSQATDTEIKAAENIHSESWPELLAVTRLNPGYPTSRIHKFKINPTAATYVRVNMYPDGGIARLRLIGTIQPKPYTDATIDLASVVNGAKPISHSNAHFGSPINMLLPSVALGMYDGWETARNPNRPEIFHLDKEGYLDTDSKEWALIDIVPGCISKIFVDTRHFKGNFPESCIVEGRINGGNWCVVVPRGRLYADREHVFQVDDIRADSVRLTIFPDGGVSRFRVFGRVIK